MLTCFVMNYIISDKFCKISGTHAQFFFQNKLWFLPQTAMTKATTATKQVQWNAICVCGIVWVFVECLADWTYFFSFARISFVFRLFFVSFSNITVVIATVVSICAAVVLIVIASVLFVLWKRKEARDLDKIFSRKIPLQSKQTNTTS